MKDTKTFRVYALIFIGVFAILMISQKNSSVENKEGYYYSDLVEDIQDEDPLDIAKIELIKSQTNDSATARVYRAENAASGTYNTLFIPNSAVFEQLLLDNNSEFIVDTKNEVAKINFMDLFTPIIIIFIMIMFFVVMRQRGGNPNDRNASFTKSRAKMVTGNMQGIDFNSVAGLDEEKLELSEVVDFLKEPAKFKAIGARIPKGLLLVGPPGTGKTLLAKAVAGESGVPFFSISGSDFVEMYVGVGASRVRDLFEQAKKNAPCLIFIDEIDAVGRKRGSGTGGGHDEREQTLNQLLVEMDGFGVNEGIIVIAATNRVDILDPALLRPGRFDRKVRIEKPDVRARLEILHLHVRNKKMSDDVDLKAIAQTTAGFAGADIENLLNEAALIAVRDGKTEVDMDSIKQAFIKVGIGTEKKNRIITKKERTITAYHETGHAILNEMLPELDHVHVISIIPTGDAGGYTMHIPSKENTFSSKLKMEQEMVSLLGGRVSEELIMGDITTGASNDIERATYIAKVMVTKYGMSKLGPINYTDDVSQYGQYIRQYGDDMAEKIDTEINALVTTAYETAKSILSENMDILDTCSKLLLEKEKLTGEEFRELFEEGRLPKKEAPDDVSETLLRHEEVTVKRYDDIELKRKEAVEKMKKELERKEAELRAQAEKDKNKK